MAAQRDPDFHYRRRGLDLKYEVKSTQSEPVAGPLLSLCYIPACMHPPSQFFNIPRYRIGVDFNGSLVLPIPIPNSAQWRSNTASELNTFPPPA